MAEDARPTGDYGPSGLLCVRAQPREDALGDFHAWYDEEHAPARTRIPGVRTAERYRRTEGDGPDWLALYDLDSLTVLERPDYQRLREDRSAREQQVMSQLAVLDRSIYRQISSAGSLPCGPAPHLLANWMTPADSDMSMFHDWYETEHIPLLLQHPDWLRSRRFELVEGSRPRFLALHDIADLSVLQSQSYARSQDTPMRADVIDRLVRRERAVFIHHRHFTIPGQPS